MIVSATLTAVKRGCGTRQPVTTIPLMLVHIVFWRLADSANGTSRDANALELKRRFDALRGVIPGMTRCEVGVDVSGSPESSHVALYSEFDSRGALDAYQAHPAHQEIVAFLKTVRTERRVVDYEV
jgi:stress responsive alpha/beta barrel protein